MSLEYVNRKGDRYYLHQGKTKTGKAKYHVSRTMPGTPVDTMPEGFEFYEHPEQGIVSIRKIRPTRILPAEREQLKAWAREWSGTAYFLVDVQDDSLVVYSPGNDPDESVRAFDRLLAFFPERRAAATELLATRAVYLAMLRFTLVDESKRLFAVDRWCFRGAIDDWFPLAGGKPLEKLARMFLPHLGKESFYELM